MLVVILLVSAYFLDPGYGKLVAARREFTLLFFGVIQMRILLIALAGLLVLAGCEDKAPGSGQPVDLTGPRDAGIPTPQPEPEPEPQMANQLVVEGSNQISMYYGDSQDLRVRYLDFGGQSIVNGEIRLSFQNMQDGGLSLRTRTVRTDANGLATFQLTAGAQDATVRVVAEADNAAPAFWNIRVLENPLGEVGIRVTYDERTGRYATSLFESVSVRLVEGTCQQALAANVPQNARTIVAPEIDPFDGDNEISISNVPSDMEFAAIAWAKNAADRNLAGQCVDGLTVRDGTPRMDNGIVRLVVEIPLADQPMEYKGIFQVEHELNMVQILEESQDDDIRNLLNVLQGVAAIGGGCPDANPAFPRGSCTLRLVCELANVGGMFCGIGELIAGPLIENLLNDQAANEPELFEVLDTIGDLYRNFAQFNVFGEMEFTSSYPTADGFLLNNDSRWQGIRFYWRDGCPSDNVDECIREFAFQGADCGRERVIAATFDALVLEESLLAVSRHQMRINYGTLLLLVLENWIIPEITNTPAMEGECGRGIDDFFAGLFDCSNPNNSLDGLVQGSCELVSQTVATLLRDSLRNADDGLDALTLEGSVNVADDYANLRADRLFGGVWNGAFGRVDEEGNPMEMVDGQMQPVAQPALLVEGVGSFGGCLLGECELPALSACVGGITGAEAQMCRDNAATEEEAAMCPSAACTFSYEGTAVNGTCGENPEGPAGELICILP